MHAGHFKRRTLLGGVLSGPWNVGDVLGVSVVGAARIVSLAGGGSTGSVVWVPAEVLAGASSFILAFALLGGIYGRYTDKAVRSKRLCYPPGLTRKLFFLFSAGPLLWIQRDPVAMNMKSGRLRGHRQVDVLADGCHVELRIVGAGASQIPFCLIYRDSTRKGEGCARG